MARFKKYSHEQTVMNPISLQDQILPGTFEDTLNTVIDELDLSTFEQRYINDEVGAPAYDPAILLKIILYAYSKGINSTRNIAPLCQHRCRVGGSDIEVQYIISERCVEEGLATTEPERVSGGA